MSFEITAANGVRVETIDDDVSLMRRVVELSGRSFIGINALRAVNAGEEIRIACRPSSEGFKMFGQAGFIVRKERGRMKKQPPNCMEYTANHVRGAPQLIWPDCPPPPQEPGQADYEFHEPDGEYAERVMTHMLYALYPMRPNPAYEDDEDEPIHSIWN